METFELFQLWGEAMKKGMKTATQITREGEYFEKTGK